MIIKFLVGLLLIGVVIIGVIIGTEIVILSKRPQWPMRRIDKENRRFKD